MGFKAGGFDKCTLVGNNSEIVDSNREIETPMTGIDTKLERERENPTNRFIKCTDKLEKKNKFEVAPRDIEKSDLKHNLLSINLKAKEKNKSVYVHAREGIKTISQQPPETTGFNPSTSNSHFSLLERARSLHLKGIQLSKEGKEKVKNLGLVERKRLLAEGRKALEEAQNIINNSPTGLSKDISRNNQQGIQNYMEENGQSKNL